MIKCNLCCTKLYLCLSKNNNNTLRYISKLFFYVLRHFFLYHFFFPLFYFITLKIVLNHINSWFLVQLLLLCLSKCTCHWLHLYFKASFLSIICSFLVSTGFMSLSHVPTFIFCPSRPFSMNFLFICSKVSL